MLRTMALMLTAVLLGTFTGCQTGQDKERQTEKMFREYLATWSTHDVEKMASFFTNDCVYENIASGQVYRGRDSLKAWARMSFAMMPDFKVEATSLFASGSWVACEWVMTGTQTGDAPGLPATGKSFKVRGSTIVELKEGKIHRNADYWDWATLMRQLGAMK